MNRKTWILAAGIMGVLWLIPQAANAQHGSANEAWALCARGRDSTWEEDKAHCLSTYERERSPGASALLVLGICIWRADLDACLTGYGLVLVDLIGDRQAAWDQLLQCSNFAYDRFNGCKRDEFRCVHRYLSDHWVDDGCSGPAGPE